MDDFSSIDSTLVQGETVTLMGNHALTYVRTRGGLRIALICTEWSASASTL